jgi:formyl-CoA transferase
MVALWERERTGQGCKVSSNLLANGLWSNALSVQAALCGLDYPSPSWNFDQRKNFKNHPVYKTSDDRWVMLNMLDISPPSDTQNFFKVIGIYEQIADDERFRTGEGYIEHGPYLIELIEEKISCMTFSELDKKSRELNVPITWVNTIYEVEHDQQAIINKMLIPVDENEWGFKYVVNHPFQIEGVLPTEFKRPPDIGEHSEEILTSLLGYSKEKIQWLKEANIV